MDEALERTLRSKEWRGLWEREIFPRSYSPEGQRFVDASAYHMANSMFEMPGGAIPVARYVAKEDERGRTSEAQAAEPQRVLFPAYQ